MILVRLKLIASMLAVALLVLLPACSTFDDNEDEDDEAAATLDLDTLQASTDAGTLQAEPMSNAFVGEVTEDLFIGVVLYEDDEYAGDEQAVGVYLCDNGQTTNAWLSGELGDDGVAQLDDGADLQVTVEVQDGVVTGEVMTSEEDSHTFTATAASGDAGLYRAEESVDGDDQLGTWVVLEDGRQRGLTCPPMPLIVCLPTGPGTSTF